MCRVQHFDQAIFKFKALVQQAAQLLEFLRNAFAFVAQVVEREQLLGNDVDARVDGLGEFQTALVVERLGFASQLFIDFEVPADT